MLSALCKKMSLRLHFNIFKNIRQIFKTYWHNLTHKETWVWKRKKMFSERPEKTSEERNNVMHLSLQWTFLCDRPVILSMQGTEEIRSAVKSCCKISSFVTAVEPEKQSQNGDSLFASQLRQKMRWVSAVACCGCPLAGLFLTSSNCGQGKREWIFPQDVVRDSICAEIKLQRHSSCQSVCGISKKLSHQVWLHVLKYQIQNQYFLHLICLPLTFPHIIWGTTEWNCWRLISRYLYLSHMPYCQSHICACWPFLPLPPTFWWVLMKRKGSINWAGHAWGDRWDGISSGLWASSLMPQLRFQPFLNMPPCPTGEPCEK